MWQCGAASKLELGLEEHHDRQQAQAAAEGGGDLEQHAGCGDVFFSTVWSGRKEATAFYFLLKRCVEAFLCRRINYGEAAG